ncbi:MAG: class I SAM-dependent rRNA methyltransferase [Acidobacteria bacterium]|nr:class I SAM-dependent rRNA methyltransferase [Acidobacteriota bacterium]
MTEARINRKGADRVASGHPWIFRSDLLGAADAQPGSVVRVLDGRNVRLGWAHYSSRSQIALRMLPFETQRTDAGFLRRLIRRAQDYRERVVQNTDAYRVVHAEADQLPGLIVDRYGDWLVVQALSQAMDGAQPALIDALQELFSPHGIVARNDVSTRRLEGLDETKGALAGEVPDGVVVTMNGVRFAADLLQGQKTGLFLDQRENYAAAAQYARGNALDCFSYNGGFALHLARACERVTAVDSSESALATVQSNARLNDLHNVETRKAKAFDLLNDYAMGRKSFDTIVLDPPAFAKSRKHVEAAARAYKEINLKALKLLERDGVLVTCSCSHHFSEADLLEAVAAAALDTGKRLRIIERRTQGRDHPIALTIPETHYLKCLILQVM